MADFFFKKNYFIMYNGDCHSSSMIHIGIATSDIKKQDDIKLMKNIWGVQRHAVYVLFIHCLST